MGEQPLPVQVGVGKEQVARDALRQAPRAALEAGNVARERAVAHGRAPVEEVHVAESRCDALQLEGIAQIREPRFLGELLRLARPRMRAPGFDRITERGDLGAVHEIDVEAGADDHRVENVFGFRCDYSYSFFFLYIFPALGKKNRKSFVLLAPEDALVGRGHLLAEDVGVEIPAACVVQRRIAELETGKGGPFRLVHLRQDRPAREHHDLFRPGLERFAGIVESRGARAEDADALAGEFAEIDVIRGVEYACAAPRGIEGGEFRPARRAAAFATEGKDDFSCIDIGCFCLCFYEILVQVQRRNFYVVLHRQPRRFAHPQQVGGPIQARDLVQLCPGRRAILLVMPRAVGEGGHTEVGSGQVLGRTQRFHARKRGPRSFASVRRPVDAAQVAHALAQQREGRGLAAHPAANHERIQHRLAVGSIGGRHPVRRREIQAGEVLARAFSEGFHYSCDSMIEISRA